MSHDPRARQTKGPFRAEGMREGGYYELSDGHPIELAPAGGRHGNAKLAGALALATDPAVTEVGTEVGHALSEGTLRAPDLSVGNVKSEPGWAKGAPALAVEYADKGTDEADLQKKIGELLGAGSRFVWVVRLVGPHRVEVYEPGLPARTLSGRQELTAPGVLEKPVPAAALYDRGVALEVTQRNILARAGVQSLEQVRNEGREEGREEGLRLAVADLCEAFALELTEARRVQLVRLELAGLEALRAHLKQHRAWPE